MSGYYCQIPGTIGRRAVLDVGLKCPSKCLHCFTREPDREAEGKDFEANNKAPWRPTEQLIKQVELFKENKFVAFDVTGGEPTLHPGIVQIVQKATDVGISSRIITLGQYLDKKDLLSKLLDAGLTDFRFSYHAPSKALFQTMTGGDIDKIHWAMGELDKRGFEYTTNTTITQANYRNLPEIALNLINRRVYYANFIFMMSHYAWGDAADKALRALYSDVYPYLTKAVDILESCGIAVGIRYAPFCSISGMEKNYVGQVGVRHDPHEWTNCVEHTGPGDAEREAQMIVQDPKNPAGGSWLVGQGEQGPFFGRGSSEGINKTFVAKCQTCTALPVCDGIDPGYLSKHGEKEFVPYMYDYRGVTIDKDRLSYLAGHVVKTKPDGTPSKAIKRFLQPDPISSYPKVSVIVPNYNHAKDLPRCLDSLFNQTYRRMQIIVVDDASTDESLKVLDSIRETCYTESRRVYPELYKEFRIIKREKNSACPPVVRNEGVRDSDGELVFYLDPDDWVEPTYVEECVRMFHKHPEASIVYTGVQCFGTEDVQWVAPPFDRLTEIQQNYIGCFSIWRREVFDETGGYDPDVNGAEDWNLWISAIRLGHIAVPLPRQLVHYCRSETGYFETYTRPNHARIEAEIRRKNNEVYPVNVLLNGVQNVPGGDDGGSDDLVI